MIVKLQQLQEASKVVEVTMNQLLFCFLVIGSSLNCSAKKHEGPPLFINDIYTNGKPDKYYSQLLTNIQKSFPILTVADIKDCIKYCEVDPQADIIQECQDFMFWKLIQNGEKTTFKKYKSN